MTVELHYSTELPGTVTLDDLSGLIEDLVGVGTAEHVSGNIIKGSVIINDRELSDAMFTSFGEDFKLGYATRETEEEIDSIVKSRDITTRIKYELIRVSP